MHFNDGIAWKTSPAKERGFFFMRGSKVRVFSLIAWQAHIRKRGEGHEMGKQAKIEKIAEGIPADQRRDDPLF